MEVCGWLHALTTLLWGENYPWYPMNSGWVYFRLDVDVLEKKRPASARSSAQPSPYTNWASVITYTLERRYNIKKKTEYFASL
jgi:hypothetical protein